MKSKRVILCLSGIIFLIFLTAITPVAYAAYGDHNGPYGENDGIHGGNCLSPQDYPPMDPRIKGWATSVVDYWRPEGLTHGTPEIVLGQPGGTFHVLSLGDGGWIIVTFDLTIANGSGPDFVVWENGFVSRTQGFDPTLLWAELMFVEVSTDGDNFARFPSVCLNPNSVGGFGCIDPTYYHNVAGKHPNGNDGRDEGTPFELDDLLGDPLVIDGTIDLNNIQYVRLIDVVGDGSTFDSLGNPMWDPWPTPFGTGGADLDAVAVLNVPLPNRAPTANAGPDQTVAEGDTVTLDGSDSFDPDDGIAAYQWTQTAGPSVTLSDATAAQPSFTAPDVGASGEAFTFELTVTDHGGLQDTDSVTVNVTSTNMPPTAVAGENQTVAEGGTVTLDGSNSFDPDDGIAAYQWTQTAGPSVTLSDATAAQPSFTAPDVGASGEAFTFELTVTDHGGLQDTDSVTVNVTSTNMPPTAVAGENQTVAEGGTVTLDGSDSFDPDDGIAAYQWTQTAGPSVTLSDATAAQPSFTAPDVGASGEAFTFELTVTDHGGLQDTDSVTVNVTSTNMPPTAVAGENQTVAEGGTVTLDGSDSFDPDDGIAAYQWTQTAGPSVTLSDSAIVQPSFTAPPVGASGEALTFELTLTDQGGLQDTDSITVNVTSTNAPPTADAGENQTVAEGDTVTLDGSNSFDPDDGIAAYQWTQTAGPSVTLSDATAAQPSFTAPDVGASGEAFTFELTVTDQGGLQDTDSITVNVTSTNAPPTADAGENQTVAEGDTVTLDGSDSSDPDDGIAAYQWTQTSGLSVTLSDATAAQPSFTAPDVGASGEAFTFELTVTDQGGLQDTDSVTVNVTSTNAPPTADAGENQTVAEGDTVTLDGSDSSDPDDGIAAYQWTQTSGPSVTLSDATAAQPSFTAPDVGASGEALTFELTVTDQGGLQDTDSLTINVEPPLNNSPDQPVLLSPPDGETGVSLTTLLRTGDFSDPESGDTHAKTEWQISTGFDFLSFVLDVTSTSHLTSLVVPESVLDEGTTYYWRVMFCDNNNEKSEWSDPYSFTTLTTSDDTDSNGIPDDQEVDKTADVDDNGTPDMDQADMKCVNTVVGEAQIGVKISTCVTSTESMKSIDANTISDTENRPDEMPLGVISLKLKVDRAGDTAEVTVYLSKSLPGNVKWYNYSTIDGWHDYSDHAIFSVDRKLLTLEFKDGGFGDADGVANGWIVDPCGPAYASSSSDQQTDSDGGGGCFISILSYGSHDRK